MGLGAWPEVGLKEARDARDRWAAAIRAGDDPISLRQRERAEAARALDQADPTFAEVAALAFEARKGALRGGGDRGRWFSPLALHVIPKIGGRRMSSLHQRDIQAALAPIWRKMPPTAEKALQRTGIVFRHGQLMGLECDPFTVEAARQLLGEVNHQTRGIAWTPWQEVPALWRALDNPAASHQCLRLMILTAVRSDAARGMRFSEVQDTTWTVPAERVKGREGQVSDFRVPLAPAAIDVLEVRARYAEGDLVFPSYRRGASITAAATEKVMRALGPGRPHGLRKSFRTWAQETRACPWDVAETILGHRIGGRIERTYATSDLLDLRRAALEAWAAFVVGT